jgi:hypothetical protein
MENRKKGETYYETHHIQPESLGGSNDKSNLVLLTAREHYIAHFLLYKHYKSINDKNKMFKMVIAWNRMRTHPNGKRYISKTFELAKKAYVKEFSKFIKNKISVKDKDGNTFQVDKNDPRYLSGELVGVNKGKVIVKDKDGNKFRVDKDDPRYLSGELVGHSKGYTFSEEQRKKMSEDRKDKKRKRIKCPHCGKIGGNNNMKRYHFDNCKYKKEEK